MADEIPLCEERESTFFGPYPLVSIVDARRKRDDAKRLLLKDVDPGAEKKLKKIAAALEAKQTFGLIADEYIKNMINAGSASATITKTRWLLEDLASPLSRRPIREIVSAEILDLLKRIEKSGRRETAKRLRGIIGSVFRLAIVTLRAEADPTIALRGALLAPINVGRADHCR